MKEAVVGKEVRRSFFSWCWYGNKIYARIGCIILEAGWYSVEAPCVGIKALEWFPHAGEIVLVWAQIAKAILCISWDYGRR